MTNRMPPGFVRANSKNLPKIDIFMLLEFIKRSDGFKPDDIRNAKLMMHRDSQENDNEDEGVGLVCLSTKEHLCTVRCRVFLEQTGRQKGYEVVLIVNTDEEKICSIDCYGCGPMRDRCEHVFALLMWMHCRGDKRREGECYWKKPGAEGAEVTKKFSEMKGVRYDDNRSVALSLASATNRESFLKDFLATAEDKSIDGQLTRYHYSLEDERIARLSIHRLATEFKNSGERAAQDFCSFAKAALRKEFCSSAELSTRHQSNESRWHELRYGRIMDSSLFEVAYCRKQSDFYTSRLIEAAKIFDIKQMKPCMALRQKIVSVFEKKVNIECRSSGLLLIPSFPMLGASPDAIGDDFVMEIKCRSSHIPIEYYIANGKIRAKYKAQIHLQMLAARVTNGFICVADPNFEVNRKMTIICEIFNEKFIDSLIVRAESFWKNHIFPKLYDNA